MEVRSQVKCNETDAASNQTKRAAVRTLKQSGALRLRGLSHRTPVRRLHCDAFGVAVNRGREKPLFSALVLHFPLLKHDWYVKLGFPLQCLFSLLPETPDGLFFSFFFRGGNWWTQIMLGKPLEAPLR